MFSKKPAENRYQNILLLLWLRPLVSGCESSFFFISIKRQSFENPVKEFFRPLFARSWKCAPTWKIVSKSFSPQNRSQSHRHRLMMMASISLAHRTRHKPESLPPSKSTKRSHNVLLAAHLGSRFIRENVFDRKTLLILNWIRLNPGWEGGLQGVENVADSALMWGLNWNFPCGKPREMCGRNNAGWKFSVYYS